MAIAYFNKAEDATTLGFLTNFVRIFAVNQRAVSGLSRKQACLDRIGG